MPTPRAEVVANGSEPGRARRIPASIVDGTSIAAVSVPATAIFATTIVERRIGFVSRWTAVPSSSSEPSAAVPKTSATSGRTTRMTSPSSVGPTSGTPRPLARTMSPTRIGMPARRSMRIVRRRPSRARRVTTAISRKIIAGSRGRRRRSRANRRSGRPRRGVTPASRATRATARVNPPNSSTRTVRRPSRSSVPNTAGSAMNAAARWRSSDERTTNVCGPVRHQAADLAEVAGRGEPPGMDDEHAVRPAARPPRGCATRRGSPGRPPPSTGGARSCGAAGAGPSR